MKNLKFGTAGVMSPPPAANTAAFQYFEAIGYDAAIVFDQLNFTIPRSLWTPDLAPVAEQWNIDCYLDSFPLMALAAAATQRIEIGITAVDAIRRPAVELAKTFLTLDHISQGRCWFALGAGEEKQFAPYGSPRVRPFTHLEDTLRVIRLFFETDEPVSYSGPVWQMTNAVLGLQPYSETAPRLMIAGGPGKALEIAGRLADGWVVYLPPPGDADWYAKQVATVKRHAEMAGRDPDQLDFIAEFMCIMDDDPGEVERQTHSLIHRWDAAATVPSTETWKKAGLTHPMGDRWAYARDLIPMEWTREKALAVAESVPPQAVRRMRICGTPTEVADQIQPYIDAGANYVITGNYAPLLATGEYADTSAGGSDSTAKVVELLRERNGVLAARQS